MFSVLESNSPARCCSEPLPALPNSIGEPRALASAMNSASVVAGLSIDVTRMNGNSVSMLIIVKSSTVR